MAHSRYFQDGTFLLPALLGEVADQVPERMHLVWADSTGPGQHPYRAVCGYNASLSIEWGRPDHDAEEDGSRNFETEWSKKYPDSQMSSSNLDVCLHGAALYRLTIALVDGARCWIPFPSRVDGGHEVTSWAVSVVGLANDLVHTTDTLDYVNRAGLRIAQHPPLANA
jgi:hypothetical protein